MGRRRSSLLHATNAISTLPTAWAAWNGKPPEVLKRVVDRTPLGRLVTMDEIVGSVLFLLDNKGVNGINLYVDGGWLLT